MRMGEELTIYKGRCANLQRDINLSSEAMSKLNLDQGSLGDQLNQYKNRVNQLEDQLVDVQREKNEHFYEVRRLQQEAEKMDATYKKLQTDTFKSQTDQHTSSATIQRLQTQLNTTQNDLKLMKGQKEELEKVIKRQKEEVLEQ